MYYQIPPDITPEEILEYLRKSRSDDATLTVEEVLEKHERQLNEWAERNLGCPIPEKNKFREVGSGETIESRPEMQRILRMIESPKIKGVLVKEVSRLGRPSLKEIGIISELFQYSNTLIITPERVFDLRNKYDKDAFEREMMRGNEYLEYFKDIQQNGRLASVSQGNYIGSIAPYGYNKIWVMDGKKKCPTLQIKEDEANVVRMIFDMFVNQNIGVHNIANKLDEMKIKPPKGEFWSANALRDTLQNIHYIGKVKWNWRKTVAIVENGEILKTRPKSKKGEYLIYDGRHEAIITEEIFNAAKEKIGNSPRTKPSKKLRNPLAGLLFCQCGRAMTMRTYGKKGKDRAEPRYLCNGQTHCETGSCLCSEMLDRICDILKECVEDFEVRLTNNTGDSAKLHAKLIKNLEKQMEDIKARELSQWEQQSHPDASQRMPAEIFKQLNERLLKEKEEVQQALCKAYESMPEPVDYEEKVAKFKDALEALSNPAVDADAKNRLLKACIERISYTRKKPQRAKVGNNKGWESFPIEIDVKLKV
jgi:DNA invertase Pin-like site-specific DNA recombinase